MIKPNRPKLTSKQLAHRIVSLAQARKAENIVLIDLRKASGVAEWFVICEGDNPVMNAAVADSIVRELREIGVRPWQEEGREEGRWVLLDFVDVVVHVMLPDVRSYYELEQLWHEYPRTRIASTDGSAEQAGDNRR